MKVRRISAKDALPIRAQMLRPGHPLEDCQFKGDNEEQTFHLGAFIDGQLASVASFYYARNKTFSETHQFQLRGMATLPEFQNQGLSRELLSFAFPIIKQNFCDLLWCNARVGASGFYQKTGFEKIGDVFEIPEIGPHLLMFKKLT